MANEKKFLDSSGIGHLWDRIEERYPNMDELGLIIDAIDEAKADRTDIIQADWNQNDETALDYVKNRTHYSERIGLVEVLPETTVSTNEENYVEIFNSIILEVGKTYTAIFNGTKYECVAWLNGDDAIYIGNGAIAGGTDIASGNIGGNGEPFSYENYDDGTFYLYVSEPGTYTIKISVQDEVIHKIDKKYLPKIPNDNILNGSARGSLRTIYSSPEDDEYVMGECAFAEGAWTHASGDRSHAEGEYTTASGYGSHAEGGDTTASSDYQHVQGKYNIEDTENKYAHIVGNGEYKALSNAHTLDWSGNAWFAGDVFIKGSGQDSGSSKKLATEQYVDTELANLVGTAPETLDTIEELAAAFQENEDVVETLNQAIGNKADKTDLENYYNKTEIDSYEFISIADIDTICASTAIGSLDPTDVDELTSLLEGGNVNE